MSFDLDRHYKSQGMRVAIISAVFVLIGVALRHEIPWYATAFFVLCLVFGVLGMIFGKRIQPRPSWDRLTIDDVGITRTAKNLREHVAWPDVARVRIMTNDKGPYLEDVFFIVDSKKGDGCVVGHDLAVKSGLLEALQSRLEGVNSKAVIEAMCSVEDQMFTIWEAKPGP